MMERILLVAVLLGVLPGMSRGQDEGEDAAKFEAIARRYQAILQRQPRRGTALDLLYRHYLDAGKVDELSRHYEDLTKSEPKNASAFLVLGLIQERRGKDDDAIKSFTRAAELSPKDFMPDYYRGLLLTEAHRDDEAVKALNLALEHDPPRTERLEIAKRLGRIHSRAGRTAEAIKVWGDVSRRFPDDRLILQELAELLAEEGQADEAIRTYRRLGELSKSDAYRKLSTKVEVGQIQVSQGKMKDAIATFDEALSQVDPESWIARDIRRRVEEIFIRSDDDAGLAAYYRERLTKRPDDLNALIRLAATTAKMGDREAALKQYRDAVKLAPSRRDLREALIGELSRAEKFPEALAETQALADSNPNDIDTLKRLGDLYLKAGKADRPAAEAKALEAWRKIAAIRPAEAGLAVQAAEACRRGAGIEAQAIGSPKKDEADKKPPAETVLSKGALDLYREAARRAPEIPQYQEYVGEYLQALGRDVEARDAWRAIASPPRDMPDNLKRLAEILASAGMLEEAIATLDRALKKEPERYDLHAMAADLLARSKKYDEALEHVTAMRKLADDPYFEEQALTRRVALYGEAGRLPDEAAKLDEKLKAPGASLDDYWLAALMANDQRRWDDAQKYLDEALKLSPFDLRLLRLKARVYASGGDLGGAAEQMKLLAAKEPKLRTNHLQDLIRVLLDLGRPADAQVAAEELVRAAPAKAESYAILADVQLRRGLVDAGLETLRRAVRIDPRDLDARRALAVALAQNQKPEEAIEHQWRLFELAEDASAKIAVSGTLAELYLSTGKFDYLVERLRQLRRQGDDSLVPSLCLVEALRRGEDYVSARRELAELLAKKPNDLQILGQLVALAESLRDLDDAITYQKKVVAISPDRADEEKLATLFTQQGKTDEASAIYEKMAREAKDADALLSGLDKAISHDDAKLVVALARPQWQARPDDWRFGLRLAEALWVTKREDEAAAIFQAILDLPPSDKYAKKPRASGPPSPNSRRMNSSGYPANYPRFWQITQAMNQAANLMQNAALRQNGGYNTLRIDDQDLAQGASLIYVREHARRQKREEAWMKALQDRSATDLKALRNLVLLHATGQDMAALMPLVAKWVERSPNDADARFVQLIYRLNWGYNGGQPGEKPDTSEIKRQYAWFVDHRPDLLTWLTSNYIQFLRNNGERPEARRLLIARIKGGDPDALSQVVYLLNDPEDSDLIDDLLARINQIQKAPAGANLRTMVPNLLQQSLNGSISRADWDKTLATFDRLMAFDSGPANGVTTAGSRSATSTAYVRNLRLNRNFNANNNAEPEYPTPSTLLDQTRYFSLNQAYQSLKIVGQLDRLTDLVDRRVKESEGASRQSWMLARSAIEWWDGDAEASLATLAKVAAMTPADMDLVMLRSKALSKHGDLKEALAVLTPLHVPFGSAAKTLEQARLQLAQRAQDDEVAKQAALRLFAMRLEPYEQVQLAQTLRRLGMTSQGHQLDQRAELTARNNPNLLFNLMQQYSQTDPAKAASLARSILQQVKRNSSNMNNRNNSIRIMAMRQLKQAGELDKMIAHAEGQVAAAPGSAVLLEDLLELYAASNDDEKQLAVLRRIGALRPDDMNLRTQTVQVLVRRRRFSEVVAMLEPAWEKAPEQVVQQLYSYLPSYVRSGHFDDLVGKVKKLKGSPQAAQFQWALVNLAQNAGNVGLKAEDTIKLYRAILEVLPESQREGTNLQFAELLARSGRKPEAYEIFKSLAFATKPPPKPQAAAKVGTAKMTTATPGYYNNRFYYQNNNNNSSGAFVRVVDLAIELNRREELAEEAGKKGDTTEGWKPYADLLRAMIARRGKDEAPLEAMALRAQADPTLLASLALTANTFHEELAACQGKPALSAAIGLWEKGADGKQALADLDMNTRRRIADACIKIGDRPKARDVLTAPTKPPVGVTNPAQQAQMRMQAALMAAENLRQMGFYLDALESFNAVLRDPFAAVSASQGNDYQSQQSRNGVAECVAKLLATGRAEAWKAVKTALDADKPSDALGPFFLVVDPQFVNGQQVQIRADRRRVRKRSNDLTPPQLIPGLLEFGGKNGDLESTAAKLAAIRSRPGADTLRLQSFAALLAMALDKPAEARSVFETWDRLAPEVKKKADWASQPETWLAVREAMRHEPTRSWGRSMIPSLSAAAVRTENLGRSASLIAALAEDGDGPEDEASFVAMIAASKGNPTALIQFAKVRMHQKRTDEAIALLDQAWRLNPNLMIQEFGEVVGLYASAGRFDSLAEGLRLMQDPNVRQQLSWQIGNQLPGVLARLRKPADLLSLYLALSEVVADVQNPNPNTKTMFDEAFARLPRDVGTLEIYRRLCFPTAKRDGQAWEFARQAADLAKQLGAIEKMEAECDKAMSDQPSWKPQGEFLKAILSARKGDERPIVLLAERRLKDPAFAHATAPGLIALRDELSLAKDPEAIRSAIGIWKSSLNTNSSANPTDVNTQSQIAGLWIKLGDREKARGALLGVWKVEIPEDSPFNNNAGNQASSEISRRDLLARELNRHGFPLDALAVYDSMTSIEDDTTNDNGPNNPPQYHDTAARQLVVKVLADESEASISALEKALKSDARTTDLAPFVVVFEETNPGEDGDKAREPFVPFLPSLLAKAKRAGRLDALAQAAAIARAKSPGDVSVLAVSALIARARDDQDGASSSLREIAAKVEKQPSLGANSAVWLAAKDALQHPETRDIGLTLAVAVARADERAVGRVRDSAATGAIASEIVAKGGTESTARLLDDRKDDALTLVKLAIAMARAGKKSEAAARLDHAWKSCPRPMMDRFRQFAPACLDAGLGADFARGLKTINGAEFHNGYEYELIHTFSNRNIEGDGRIADVIAIHQALADAFGESRNAAIQEALCSFLVRVKRPKEALEIRRRQVFPPTGPADHLPPSATSLADLAKEVGALGAIESECRAALEKDPKWGARGELLIAMIARREDKEGPLEDLAGRHRKDPSLAHDLESSRAILVAECSRAKSRPVLELARDLLKENIERREQPANTNQFSPEDQLAQVYMKLGDRDRALQTWREVLELPLPGYYNQPGYTEWAEANHRVQVAKTLAKNGFLIDAIAVFEQVTATPLVKSNWMQKPETWRGEQRTEGRNLLLDLLADHLEDATARLDAELSGETPDVSAFLTPTHVPWTSREQSRIPEWARGTDPSWTSLAGAVMASSKKAGKLESLADRLAEARTKHPKDDALVALEAIARMALGDAAKAAPLLEETSARVKRDSSSGRHAEVLPLLQSAGSNPAVRDAGKSLRKRAFEAASRRDDIETLALLLDGIAGVPDREALLAAQPSEAARVLAWHGDHAEVAESSRFWEPAAWHLDHLVASDPENMELRARRARARAALGDREGAASDFRLASDRPGTLVSGLDDDINAPGLDFASMDAFTVETWVFGWSGPAFRQMVPDSTKEHVWIYYGPVTFAGWRVEADKIHFSPTQPLSPGWTHVALVFDGKRQRTFVNGKKAGDFEVPRPMAINPPGPWSIGPGLPDARYTRGGFLGSLRVSTVARYAESFTPDKTLAPDDKTAVLYDFSRASSGETVTDQSGHGHHAKMRGGLCVQPGKEH